jgi:hypothetical protein
MLCELTASPNTYCYSIVKAGIVQGMDRVYCLSLMLRCTQAVSRKNKIQKLTQASRQFLILEIWIPGNGCYTRRRLLT